jgi:Glycosyl transferase family 2
VRRGRTWRRSAKVVRVHLDEGLRPLEVEPRYQHALLVVLSRDGFLGQALVPAEPVLTVERQWEAITRELEDRLWVRQVRDTFIRAVGGLGDERPDRSDPTVSVIVCTRDRPSDLRSCLDSIAALRTRPVEVIVVDNSPSDGAARELCRDYPVRYVLESSPGLARARNRGIVEARGEVVAFTDDDCVVDRHWLDGLGDPFHDPLVMALTGYAGPLELETPAQYLFEVHGGFQRFSERRLFDGASSSPISVAAAAGAGANSLFRRRVFGCSPRISGPGRLPATEKRSTPSIGSPRRATGSSSIQSESSGTAIEPSMLRYAEPCSATRPASLLTRRAVWSPTASSKLSTSGDGGAATSPVISGGGSAMTSEPCRST